jgi:hypothetical protein
MGPGQERALEALGPRFVLPYDPTLRFIRRPPLAGTLR